VGAFSQERLATGENHPWRRNRLEQYISVITAKQLLQVRAHDANIKVEQEEVMAAEAFDFKLLQLAPVDHEEFADNDAGLIIVTRRPVNGERHARQCSHHRESTVMRGVFFYDRACLYGVCFNIEWGFGCRAKVMIHGK